MHSIKSAVIMAQTQPWSGFVLLESSTKVSPATHKIVISDTLVVWLFQFAKITDNNLL